MKALVGKKKGGQANGEQESDDGRCDPQPQFPPLNAPKIAVGVIRLRESRLADSFFWRQSPRSPNGVHSIAQPLKVLVAGTGAVRGSLNLSIWSCNNLPKQVSLSVVVIERNVLKSQAIFC